MKEHDLLKNLEELQDRIGRLDTGESDKLYDELEVLMKDIADEGVH